MNLLSKAADLLEQPNAWCQGSIARDAKGERVGVAQSPRACSWCIIGAVVKAAGSVKLPDGIIHKIKNAAVADDVYLSLGSWNDEPSRTKNDVVAVLRKAAEA